MVYYYLLILNFLILEIIYGIELIKLNSSMLDRWYGPVESCYIQSADPTIPDYEVINRCKKEAYNSSLHNQHISINHKVTFIATKSNVFECCTREMPITDRGLDLVVKGYEDPSAKPLLELFSTLSKQNKSIIFIGDSMTLQLNNALEKEILRENLHMPQILGLPTGISEKTSARMKIIHYRFDPNNNDVDRNGDDVYYPIYYFGAMLYNHVYDVDSDKYDSWKGSDWFMQNLVLELNKLHSGGLVVVSNMGLHIPYREVSGKSAVFVDYMSSFLAWLNKIADDNPKSVVAFKETTPTYFDSFPYSDNGDYAVWKANNSMKDKNMQPNTWNKSLYWCRKQTSPIGFENLLVRNILNSWESSNIDIVPIYDYFLPFWAMKRSHCSLMNKLDCVHFCSQSPMLYIPVWYEVIKLVNRGTKRKKSQKKPPFIASVKSEDKFYYMHKGIFRPIVSNTSAIITEFATKNHLSIQSIHLDITSKPVGYNVYISSKFEIKSCIKFNPNYVVIC